MMNNPFFFAFGLTLLAGLCTGIGSLLSLIYKKFNPKFLGIMLGISAGVMLYVSFVEILSKARISLGLVYGDKLGYTYAVIGFFVGMISIIGIDKLIPSHDHDDECDDDSIKGNQNQKLLRLGIFSALALAIHNFPEGLATFMSAMNEPSYGISIAVAVAIHNIPEGIAVAIPIYYATKSRKKAFWYSFLSGLAEPVGAVIGYFVLRQFFDDSIFGIIFAGVAGIMVYISLNELIPTAKEYAGQKITMTGVIIGMMIMAGSLLLFL
ncbi:MAG: zinc transporter ZupT [Flavobacteriaceae bacterium]|nr:zinc transporter ZupT [Candidatus Onthonaster equi]